MEMCRPGWGYQVEESVILAFVFPLELNENMEKDGDTSEWGTFQIDGRSARGGQQSANDAYAQAINTGSKLLALNVIKELAPKDYVLQFHNLNRTA